MKTCMRSEKAGGMTPEPQQVKLSLNLVSLFGSLGSQLSTLTKPSSPYGLLSNQTYGIQKEKLKTRVFALLWMGLWNVLFICQHRCSRHGFLSCQKAKRQGI